MRESMVYLHKYVYRVSRIFNEFLKSQNNDLSPILSYAVTNSRPCDSITPSVVSTMIFTVDVDITCTATALMGRSECAAWGRGVV